VITGFGRTGRWFALQHWGVQPDMMTIAKAVTSAYVPLAAFIMSSRIHEALLSSPPEIKLWHGYTNAGHPVACAVGLRNLQIIEEEGLIEAAASLGGRLLDGLRTLSSHANVGDVRGLGLIAAVEVVADKQGRMPFKPAQGVGPKLMREMRSRGLITRVKGESILLAPPLVSSPEQIDRMVDIIGESINATLTV
jgi:adenosylmethionine-8-amino-7-oxononanoate aminotransferase